MRNLILGIRSILWPVVILILGVYFIFVLGAFLQDYNKTMAATNSAYCQIELQKQQLADPSAICKNIFDSARR